MRGLSEIYNTYGSARMLSDVFQEDKDITGLLKKSSKMQMSGDAARRKFDIRCNCEKVTYGE